MAVVAFLVAAVVIVGLLVVFHRAVFGGSTFRRERRRGRRDDDAGRGPRPDSHPGATEWTSASRWGQWGPGGDF